MVTVSVTGEVSGTGDSDRGDFSHMGTVLIFSKEYISVS